jgi:hypothetical protein
VLRMEAQRATQRSFEGPLRRFGLKLAAIDSGAERYVEQRGSRHFGRRRAKGRPDVPASSAMSLLGDTVPPVPLTRGRSARRGIDVQGSASEAVQLSRCRVSASRGFWRSRMS